MDGVLIIDKPAGFTSHDVVAKVRRILRTKRVGHTGTLDPFATGVMVILVGKATRLAQFLDKDEKEYEATVRFGFETDTGDLTGKPKAEGGGRQGAVSVAEIEEALPEFRGEIEQTPPMYSAKKIEGQKLYELARKGIEVERKAVRVYISELEMIDLWRSTEADKESEPGSENFGLVEATSDSALSTQYCKLRVVCSAGTYIRTLAEEIGRKVGSGAHLTALRRTRAGKFALPEAVTLEKLEEIVSANKLGETVVSMNEAVSHLSEKRLTAEEVARVKNGMKLQTQGESRDDNQTLRLTDEAGNLVALGLYEDGKKIIQPKTVLL